MYRDLADFNGPLAPYLNAGLFHTFGPGLMVLAYSNLVVAAGCAVLLFALLKRIGDRYSATLAVFVFATVFAFSRVTLVGNYNYLCPYSHEVTYGIALSLAAIYLVVRYGERGRTGYVVGSGLSAGLVFLTKPELFLALTAAVACGLWRTRRLGRPTTASIVWVAAMLSPPLLAVAGFSRVMPWMAALHAVLTGWSSALNFKVTGLFFYRVGMGTDDIPVSIAVLAAKAGRVRSGRSAWLRWWRSARRAGCGGCRPTPSLSRSECSHGPSSRGLCRWPSWPWPRRGATGRPPRAKRCSRSPGTFYSDVRVRQYGFGLAMPATMLLVVLLTSVVPAIVSRRGGNGARLRQTATVFLLGIMAVPVVASVRDWRLCSVPVGSGRDRFLADERGRIVQAAVDAVDSRLKPDETLLVMPEGVMIELPWLVAGTPRPPSTSCLPKW